MVLICDSELVLIAWSATQMLMLFTVQKVQQNSMILVLLT